MNKGLYIAFEGGEGCGKGTQQRILAERLEILYPGRVVCVREPGGTPFAEIIREIIFHKGIYRDVVFDAKTESYLFATARCDLLSQKVKPALENGFYVITDRCDDSSKVYQGLCRKVGLEIVRTINQEAVGMIKPDLVLILNLPPEVGLARKKKGDEWNRFEEEELQFHQTVRRGYLHLAAQNPNIYKVINAEQSVEEVARDVWKYVEPLALDRETARELMIPGKERR